MKKIRSYTSIWSVEKVLYSINDFRLPFPITFTQMTWFVVSLFAVMILGNLPNVIKLRNGIFEGKTKNVLLFFCRKFEFFC